MADFKRFLATEGATITLTDCWKKDHKWLNIPRKVEKYQTNSVKLAGGSWLQFEKVAAYDFKGDEVVVYWITGSKRGDRCLTYKLSMDRG